MQLSWGRGTRYVNELFRDCERNSFMNVVMIIPTGIGCKIGGHAGDATPAARILSVVCDNLIVHPNVINASDIAETTNNMLYVEGSVLDEFLEYKIALKEVYSNRILLAVNSPIKINTVNSVNAAINTLGADIKILELDTPLTIHWFFDTEGRASGSLDGHRQALEQIKRKGNFDTLAIQTVVRVDKNIAEKYLIYGGVNPWGGAEAVCSKYFSSNLKLQCAHAPLGDGTLADFKRVVDPRMAAEMVSVSYIHCVLKGLHTAPQIVNYSTMSKRTIRGGDIDLLVSPDGCWGRPHIACMHNGIPILFVRENETIYRSHDSPIKGCYFVETYLEAAGFIASMKIGIGPTRTRKEDY